MYMHMSLYVYKISKDLKFWKKIGKVIENKINQILNHNKINLTLNLSQMTSNINTITYSIRNAN